MKLNWEDFPDMTTYIEKHKNEIPEDCIDRALVGYFSNESIKINPFIMQTMGIAIAILSAVFIEKQRDADETMENLDALQGYYKSKEAMELHLQSKYTIDKNNKTWFAYDYPSLCKDVPLPESEIIEGVKALIHMNFLQHVKETGIDIEQDWYTVNLDAHYGMIVYSAYTTGVMCDDVEEEDDIND